ncbi:MAG TPA: hypothetical protein PLX60_13675 [Chitinophagales bacterium]|jgi:hypothetical protein|nr:hypothetical protein [Chitinophagales bacterium]
MALLRETLPYLIPVLTAILGALFAIYQLKLNAITQARIKWIENVRELISSIVHDINIIGTEYSDMEEDLREKEKELSDEEFDKYEEELERKVDEIIKPYIHSGDRQSFQLQLYLSKFNPDHNKLISLIDEFIDKSWDDDVVVVKQSRVLEEKIVDISRKILQDEWNKIYKSNRLNPLY